MANGIRNRKFSRAHARTPLQNVFLTFTSFTKGGYLAVIQWVVSKELISLNPSPEGGDFERMTDGVKEVKEKTRNLCV